MVMPRLVSGVGKNRFTRGVRLAAWLIAALPVSAQAQQAASLSGFVTDASSGETLIAANVVLVGSGAGTATNTAGWWTLTGLEEGTYTVGCSYIGYETFQRDVTLLQGDALRLDIELVPRAVAIDEITVSATRAENEEERNIGVAQLSIATIKNLPTMLEADVFRSLHLLPGVKAASDYSSGLYIRGGDPGQTLILLDRTTVYNPSHVFGFFSTFNPDAIKDVRLYKGGFPASYGGRIGSVLDIYNKDGNRRELRGSATLGLLASRALAEGPYKKGSWMVAIRRSTLEPLLKAFKNVEGIPDAFHFVDVNAKINLDVSPNDQITVSGYLGGDALELEFLDDARLDLEYGNRTVSVDWLHVFSGHLFSNFTVTNSRYKSTPRVYFGGTEIRQDNRIRDTSVKGDFEWSRGERHTLQGGFWAGVLDLPFESSFDGQAAFSPRIRSAYAAAYAEETFRPSPLWTIRGGLRATFFSNGTHWRFAPRLSAERQLGRRIRLQGSVGRYYQFQTLITNESFTGFDFWLTAGKGVEPAYGDQFILGLKTTPIDDLTADVEVYFRTMRDLFVVNPFLGDPAGLEYVEYFSVGQGLAYGLEIQITRSRGRLSGFVSYTLGKTNRRFPELNVGVDGTPTNYPPKHDRRHDLTAMTTWHLGRSWQLTCVFAVATGQAFTDPDQYYKLVNTDLVTGGTVTDVLLSPGLNRARLPTYHRLDAGVTRRGRFFGFADYELQIQVINAYAQRNIWFILHEFEQENRVRRQEIPQIPIPLPNLSLGLRF